MSPIHLPSRRAFCVQALAAAAVSLLPRSLRAAATSGVRTLSFRNTHTGESLETVYFGGGRYIDEGLSAIDWILRDHRTGDVAAIDPGLLDLLHLLRTNAAGEGRLAVFEIISGYRSPRSNEALRKHSGAVARHSLHVEGMAADVRLTNVPLALLRDAALDLKRGGVGYYPSDGFLHLDTGRIRRW